MINESVASKKMLLDLLEKIDRPKRKEAFVIERFFQKQIIPKESFARDGYTNKNG